MIKEWVHDHLPVLLIKAEIANVFNYNLGKIYSIFIYKEWLIMESQGNVLNGVMWGTMLSIPLWAWLFLLLKILFTL